MQFALYGFIIILVEITIQFLKKTGSQTERSLCYVF